MFGIVLLILIIFIPIYAFINSDKFQTKTFGTPQSRKSFLDFLEEEDFIDFDLKSNYINLITFIQSYGSKKDYYNQRLNLLHLEKILKKSYHDYFSYRMSAFDRYKIYSLYKCSEFKPFKNKIDTYIQNNIKTNIQLIESIKENNLNKLFNHLEQNLKFEVVYNLDPTFLKMKKDILESKQLSKNSYIINLVKKLEDNIFKPYSQLQSLNKTQMEIKEEQLKQANLLLKSRIEDFQGKGYIDTKDKEINDMLTLNNYYLKELENHY